MSLACKVVVPVHSLEGKASKTVEVPDVMSSSIRSDLIQFVHKNISKNSRLPHGVFRKAGHQTSAESWGTGRAVARIPRVPGGGTHRSGQAAFGNMCRGGHMFAPLKAYRRWHVKTPMKIKRRALASSIAASAVAPLVMARGHRITNVPSIPLVVSSEFEQVTKTKDAKKVLESLGCGDDLEKVKQTRKFRAGKGKYRTRKYQSRKGPLVLYGKDEGIVKALGSVQGVDVKKVSDVSILELAPGGACGRLVVWTESALDMLNELYGTSVSEAKLKGFVLHKEVMHNSDVTRIIKSDEIQKSIKK